MAMAGVKRSMEPEPPTLAGFLGILEQAAAAETQRERKIMKLQSQAGNQFCKPRIIW